MALPDILKDKLRLPVVGAPLFIVSHPALVIAQCKAGIVGAFPALNARPTSLFRLGQPSAEVLSDAATSQCLREPRQQRPRFVDERMRRIDHEKPGARERLLAVCANWPVADVKFEPKDVRGAERGD